jgi:DNA-binding NarL/FixJ family response regulator
MFMMHPIKIIFTDDKELFRKAVIDVLHESGKIDCIGEASNGKELLQLLKSKKPDVILLDLDMPVMDGNEAMSEVMRIYPESKILVISYHYESELVEDYLRRGAKGYICKDTISGNIPLLVHAINDINEGHLFVHESPPSKIYSLTRRQKEIIPLMCNDMTNKEIAKELGINERSVEKHKQRLYNKTNSQGSASFLKHAFRKGLDFLERRTLRSGK